MKISKNSFYFFTLLSTAIITISLFVITKITSDKKPVITDSKAIWYGCRCIGPDECPLFSTRSTCEAYGPECIWKCETPPMSPTPPPKPTCKWDCLPGSFSCQYSKNGTCVSPKKCCMDSWGTLTVQKCTIPIGETTCIAKFTWDTRNTPTAGITDNDDSFLYETTQKSGTMRQSVSSGTHTYILSSQCDPAYCDQVTLDLKTVTINRY